MNEENSNTIAVDKNVDWSYGMIYVTLLIPAGASATELDTSIKTKVDNGWKLVHIFHNPNGPTGPVIVAIFFR